MTCANCDMKALLCPPYSRGRADRAFTLVELLVVVAIIAVLAAIAFPVFGRVQNLGRVAKSTSNLRQIQLANIKYATDHNMNFVEGQISGGDIWMWNAEFYTYFGFDRAGYAYGKFPEVFYSPLVDRSKVSYSYGYNVTKLTLYDPTSTKRTRNSLRLDQASQVLAFAEAQDWQIRMNEADLYDGTEKYRALTTAYRAGGSGNTARTLVAFYDGHVGPVSRSQVVGNKILWAFDYE